MAAVPNIRPISDLRNSFSEVSQLVHETNEPVFLTKNGRSDMVVMSVTAYENDLFETEIYRKLRESEVEAASTGRRLTHDEVFGSLHQQLDEAAEVRDIA